MVLSKEGNVLLMAEEDEWFCEALYEQATNAAIRLMAMTERVHLRDKPRSVSTEFVLEDIKAMMKDKLKNLRTEVVKIGQRYYVEIAGDAAFSQQPLVPFKGFYNWAIKNGVHTGGFTNITPGDLFIIANEQKIFKQ